MKHTSKASTLTLKPRADMTRNSKLEYQWVHKKDWCPPKSFKKKNSERISNRDWYKLGVWCAQLNHDVSPVSYRAMAHRLIQRLQFLAKQAIWRGRFSCRFGWTFDMIPISVWRLYDQVWRHSAELQSEKPKRPKENRTEPRWAEERRDLKVIWSSLEAKSGITSGLHWGVSSTIPRRIR